MDVPVHFQGTREERVANFRSHNWRNGQDGPACVDCDTQPAQAAAYYPCGADVPRTQTSG